MKPPPAATVAVARRSARAGSEAPIALQAAAIISSEEPADWASRRQLANRRRSSRRRAPIASSASASRAACGRCDGAPVAVENLLERERELTAVDELVQRGGVVLVEGRAGIGKSALLEAACRRATRRGREVLCGHGSELESGFAFGVVRQLFERRLANAQGAEREALLAGSAGAVRSLLLGEPGEPSAFDTSFAVLHGLYWLTVNLADGRPLLTPWMTHIGQMSRRSVGWLTWLPGSRGRR
jgi:hypothetical protein